MNFLHSTGELSTGIGLFYLLQREGQHGSAVRFADRRTGNNKAWSAIRKEPT